MRRYFVLFNPPSRSATADEKVRFNSLRLKLISRGSDPKIRVQGLPWGLIPFYRRILKKVIFSGIILLHLATGWSQNHSFQFDNYNTQDGLSDHYITALYQDRYGWIWIGTGMGIERFDGIDFKTYPIEQVDGSQINDFLVRNFYETGDGNMYVCVEDYGLAKYSRDKDLFERVLFNGEPVLADVSVKSLAEDRKENLWAATKEGIQKLNFKDEIIEQYLHYPDIKNSLSDNYVRRVLLGPNDQLWIGTRSGLDRFNPKTFDFIHYSENEPALGEDILDLMLDTKGRLWVGTGSNGVFIIDHGEIKALTILSGYERSNKVNCILQEDESHFWIGTRGGLFLYDEVNDRLEQMKNNPLDPKSIAHNSIIDLIHDKKGDLWVASRGGLSYLAQEKQFFKNYSSLGGQNRSLNDNEVYAIWQDDHQNIWFGTEAGGVNILDRSTGTYRYFTKENSGLTSNCIKTIVGIDNIKVLIGTFDGGLNVYNENSGQIRPVKYNSDGVDRSIVWDICIDHRGTIWLGTVSGLDRYDPANQTMTHYPELDGTDNGITWIKADLDNDLWLGGNPLRIYRPGAGIVSEFEEKARGCYFDSKGRSWVMTIDKGIALYDKQKGAIRYVNNEDGMPSNLTYCMLEDRTGKLWVSTAKGLCCYNPENDSVKNFYYYNGLHGNQFHYGAAWLNANGEMFFGGINGATSFNPGKMVKSDFIPPIYITDFKVFNKSVKIGKDKYAELKKSIPVAEEVVVPYRSNVLTFEFASLNYTNSQMNRYRYILEGFDQDWNETEEGVRKATYTNLDPGDYVFKVVAGNSDDFNDQSEASIKLVVVPPIYMTNWFKGVIIFVGLVLLIVLFITILRRRERRKTIEFEQVKAQKLHELDTFKLKLFTNISHEIKTPLTLIITPLKKILKKDIDNPELKEDLKLMEHNASHLMSLVTQLLDYRKLQEGKLELELKQGDFIRFCKNNFDLFNELMTGKGITGRFTSVQKELFCSFDPEKVRKILNNLISNAVRYNKKGGDILFQISLVIVDEQSFIKIDVKDTGIGMSEDEMTRIFDRYYSSAGSDEYASSGIGLAYTRELVELHNGSLTVQSVPGEGSVFTLQLPLIEDGAHSKEGEELPVMKAIDFIRTKDFEEVQKGKKVILLVEDNADLRKFIKSSLGDQYVLLDTGNGSEGLDIAIQAVPDLIISDVMMPGVSGLELTEKIKQDERTSHIPLILLTALSSDEKMKEGLGKGADDYITKPFDVDILKAKIENLFQLRQSLIEKYGIKFNYVPKQQAIKSLDDKFLDKLIRLVEDNMSNPDLSVETFIDQLAVSRMQLYRKTAALTGMSVKELVNDIRLKKAEALLKENKLGIAQVAEVVGFNDTSYFGKSFKKRFGESPSAYKNKQ